MRHYLILFTTIMSTLILVGCGDDNTNLNGSSNIPEPLTVTALFDLSNNVIPFPNDVLFNGSEDGTLNIPVTDPNDISNPSNALNALDGFSTIAPWSTSFGSTLNAATIIPGTTVRMFEVETTAQGAVIQVIAELTGNVDFTAVLASVDTSQSTIEIRPLKPLHPKSTYMAVLTDGIQSIGGGSAIADVTFGFLKHTTSLLNTDGSSVFATLTTEQAQTLEPLRQLTNTMLTAAASQGISSDQVVLTWTASTQSIDDVLRATRDIVRPQPAPLANTGQTTAVIGAAGAANIIIGTLTTPYFLDANNPLGNWWKGVGGSHLTRFNPTPVATGTVTIPILITLPNTDLLGIERPAAGWPVVIFLHGITRNRLDLLAVADSFAQAGFAAIAIDIPLHGLTDPTSATTGLFHAQNTPFPNDQERTLDLDLVNNETGATGPDGITDESGRHFINLASLLTSRDNARQGVSDLFTLTKTIPNMQLDNVNLFNPNAISFAGHSLGSIIGTVFVALEPNVKAVSLAMPGGGIPKLLNNSPRFSPEIDAGLAQSGLIRGTSDYEKFFVAAQTATDAGDPINYANAASARHPIHLIEIIGGAGSLPDQVIPNQIADSPLSGTEPLIREMGLTSINTTTQNTSGVRGVVRFTAGNHGSILDPTENAAVTVEIQTQMAGFLANDGTVLPITDPTFIQ